MEKNATRIPMISTKRIGIEKAAIQELVLKNKKSEVELFHVVGTATKCVVKTSEQYEKESIEFQGSFMAVNALTGEQFRSGKLYIPTILETELAAEVVGSGHVEIALTITAIYNEKSGTSYALNGKSHVKEDTAGFDKLLALIPAVKKQLSAPSKK